MTTGVTTERAPYPAAGQPERERLLSRLADRARFIRLETVRLAEIPGAGHYTGTFSAAELLASLYYAELRYQPGEPGRPDRDRMVLSKGHAEIGLYPVLADVGFFDARLLDYTRLGSAFGDHSDMRKITGVDFRAGSLGHGLSVSGLLPYAATFAPAAAARRARRACPAGPARRAHYQLDGAGVEAVARALLAR